MRDQIINNALRRAKCKYRRINTLKRKCFALSKLCGVKVSMVVRNRKGNPNF